MPHDKEALKCQWEKDAQKWAMLAEQVSGLALAVGNVYLKYTEYPPS